MDALVVRDASPTDGPAVVTLLRELGYPTTEQRVESQLRRGTAYGSQVIVASDHGVVSAFVSLQQVYAFAEDEAVCRLTAIAVAPAARRRGLGQLLVEVVEQRATDAFASLVAINCGLRPERESAHRLYQRLGYEGTATTDHVDYVKRLR